jgi:hypothetical protein
MARKKQPLKPMSDLRFDFVASLENVCQQALMLMQAAEMVVRHDATPEPIRKILAERVADMRDALIGNDDEA